MTDGYNITSKKDVTSSIHEKARKNVNSSIAAEHSSVIKPCGKHGELRRTTARHWGLAESTEVSKKRPQHG